MTLNDYAVECYEDNYKWLHDKEGNPLPFNIGEKIALMHSELSECLEGERKDAMDEHLPHRRSGEVELVDLLIRAFQFAHAMKYDLDGAYVQKRHYNSIRADHSYAAREAEGGKKF